MTDVMASPDWERRMRRAEKGATQLLRHYKRECGGFKLEDALDRLGFCRWLAERIRIHGPNMDASELDELHRNLLEKLYVIDFGVVQLLGMPQPVYPDGKKAHPSLHEAQRPNSNS